MYKSLGGRYKTPEAFCILSIEALRTSQEEEGEKCDIGTICHVFGVFPTVIARLVAQKF